jgi:hypothetical protein
MLSVIADSDTALVFDEVVTGFRIHPGGAQALFGVRADIATYGKVIGGGMPIGIVAGRAKYMDALDGGAWQYGDDSAPEVGVTFFAGTFVRHPLALAAARAVLLHLKAQGSDLQRGLNLRTTAFVEALRKAAADAGAPIRIHHFSSWFCINFPPDLPLSGIFFTSMRGKGVHIWEGRPCFLTLAHSDADLAHVLRAFSSTIAEMQVATFLPEAMVDTQAAAPLDDTQAAAPLDDTQAAAPLDDTQAAAPLVDKQSAAPLPGARKGRDSAGNAAWFVPDPNRPGKYLQLDEPVTEHG